MELIRHFHLFFVPLYIKHLNITQMKHLTVYFFISLLILSSCKKYDEGPAISLRSKEKRLCQEWKLDKVLQNGEVGSQDGDIVFWEFQKNGNLNTIHQSMEGGSTVSYSMTLQWRWSKDKEKIEITVDHEAKNDLHTYASLIKYSHNIDIISMQIIKLKIDQLILEIEDDGNILRLEFKQR